MARQIKCDFSNEKNGNCKLLNTEVLQMRRDWATGQWTLRELASRFGISHGHAYRIVKRIQR